MARCLYLKMQTLRHAYKRALNDPQYIILPSNISELNDYMCGPMNRKAISVVSVLMDSVHRLHHLTTWPAPTAQLQGIMEFLFLFSLRWFPLHSST